MLTCPGKVPATEGGLRKISWGRPGAGTLAKEDNYCSSAGKSTWSERINGNGLPRDSQEH